MGVVLTAIAYASQFVGTSSTGQALTKAQAHTLTYHGCITQALQGAEHEPPEEEEEAQGNQEATTTLRSGGYGGLWREPSIDWRPQREAGDPTDATREIQEPQSRNRRQSTRAQCRQVTSKL